jgi:hypothetical protein
MNDPIVPKLEPMLIPEGSTKRRKKKSKGPAVVFHNTTTEAHEPPKVEVPEPPKPPEPPAEPEPTKYTLEQAFDYFYGPVDEWELNIERATRAVAFLLHFCSEMGNEDVEGRSAAGLGHILERVAAEVAQHPMPEIRYIAVGPAPKDEPTNPSGRAN